jgi:L-fuconolactonase
VRIDAHHHFWKTDRGDYAWLTRKAHPEIYRDFGPTDLEPLLENAEVERTVLIQAAATLAETEYLLTVGSQTAFVAGVVGWVDFESENAEQTISNLARNKLLVGFRPMIQDLPDDEWMLSPKISAGVRAICDARLCFDALIKPRHLGSFLGFVDRYPDLRTVIDHGAKPDIQSGDISSWRADMQRVARSTTAFCKLSGLASEAGKGWSSEGLKPCVDILLESFGPARLMWGSDWPVLNEVGDYATWLAAADWLTRSLSKADRDAVFGDTAAAFYRLNA